MDVQTLLLAMSIPSAITAFCFWLLKRMITKRDAEAEENRKKRQQKHDEDEKRRDELQVLIIRLCNASMALSEATAKAVQRIPDAHCNGDMDKALEFAEKVKSEQKDFMTEHAIKNIFDFE